MRASLLHEVSEAKMKLVSDTTNTSNLEAKVYELAYSSPVAAEQIGLWFEALLANEFETFSAKGQKIPADLAKKLSGWPLAKTREIDLSGSPASDETVSSLGKLHLAEWIDLSQTEVTDKVIPLIIEQAPNLKKLQIKNTKILWTPELVDQVLSDSNIEELETADR